MKNCKVFKRTQTQHFVMLGDPKIPIFEMGKESPGLGPLKMDQKGPKSCFGPPATHKHWTY